MVSLPPSGPSSTKRCRPQNSTSITNLDLPTTISVAEAAPDTSAAAARVTTPNELLMTPLLWLVDGQMDAPVMPIEPSSVTLPTRDRVARKQRRADPCLRAVGAISRDL